jgi:hypothetical protein
METVKAGDVIIWKMPDDDDLAHILSFALCLKDRSWRARKWKGWHMGYVVTILDDGSIVTSQAVNVQEGVRSVTYGARADMGECHIYTRLINPDLEHIKSYAAWTDGAPYSISAYFWVIFTYLFNFKIAFYDRGMMCWDNVSRFCRVMGSELEPVFQEPLISNILNELERVQNAGS